MTTSESTVGPSITSHDVEGTTHVVLCGEIDAALRDQASEAMLFVVSANNPVVADVAGVTFIDSSGLAFLVQLHRLCAESGLQLELRDPSQNILDLLEILGMATEFTVTYTQVCESLGSGALSA